MLPLDSKRWERLDGPVGKTDVHRTIEKFQNFLDQKLESDILAIDEINRQAIEFSTDVFEDLDHQQTTYPSTAAAVPHLLAIASRLPNESRCHLWETCGIMHSDSAGFVNQEDLAQWYETSVSKVITEIVPFAINTRLATNEQYQLFSAIANFHDELYVYYAFRAFDSIEFECVHCHTSFEGEMKQSEFVCQAIPPDSAEEPFRLRQANLSDALTRPGFDQYRCVVDPAMKGKHQAVLDWLSNRLGTFQCPHCRRESWPIEYGFRGDWSSE